MFGENLKFLVHNEKVCIKEIVDLKIENKVQKYVKIFRNFEQIFVKCQTSVTVEYFVYLYDTLVHEKCKNIS